jgi:hypothetical protein
VLSRSAELNIFGSFGVDNFVDKLFTLLPEPPRWKKKPQSGVYSTGSNGILLCEAEGEPQPTIKWRVNGSPVDSKCNAMQRAVVGRIGNCQTPRVCVKYNWEVAELPEHI